MDLITTSQLVLRTGLSRVTIWRYGRRYDDFPKPIVIGGIKRWVSQEIDDWLLSHRSNAGEN
jgi:predicted DNA-binding transcriptional regulator AlpA